MLYVLETSVNKDKSDVFREIVIFQDEISRKSHKVLFSMNDSCYKRCCKNIVDTVLEVAQSGLSKLHIIAGWENILRLAVWTCDRPLIHEVLSLIKKTGVKEDELTPFKNADINDLFPWLYYSNRFDILRRICSAAKTKIESKIDSRKVVVYCHLVSDETEKIVASSL
jgi:hypothetical protein